MCVLHNVSGDEREEVNARRMAGEEIIIPPNAL